MGGDLESGETSGILSLLLTEVDADCRVYGAWISLE